MRIHIYFAGSNTVPFQIFDETVAYIHKIISSIEREEISRIREEIPEIDEDILEEVLDRFDEYGLDATYFRIEAIKPGSVELGLALVAFGWWLLDKTVGDTLNEAWKESELHRKIKEFFLCRKHAKLEEIKNEVNKPNLEQITRVISENSNRSVSVPMFARIDPETGEIWIRVQQTIDDEIEDSGPPTWEEIE